MRFSEYLAITSILTPGALSWTLLGKGNALDRRFDKRGVTVLCTSTTVQGKSGGYVTASGVHTSVITNWNTAYSYQTVYSTPPPVTSTVTSGSQSTYTTTAIVMSSAATSVITVTSTSTTTVTSTDAASTGTTTVFVTAAASASASAGVHRRDKAALEKRMAVPIHYCTSWTSVTTQLTTTLFGGVNTVRVAGSTYTVTMPPIITTTVTKNNVLSTVTETINLALVDTVTVTAHQMSTVTVTGSASSTPTSSGSTPNPTPNTGMPSSSDPLPIASSCPGPVTVKVTETVYVTLSGSTPVGLPSAGSSTTTAPAMSTTAAPSHIYITTLFSTTTCSESMAVRNGIPLPTKVCRPTSYYTTRTLS